MIVRDSRKHHPEFDLVEARRVFIESGHDKGLLKHIGLCGEQITSPYHLFSVEELRDRLGLRLDKGVPTDVFVFGKGEPDRPDCTKVGGQPYWPRDEPWPIDDVGAPLRFLAQFNFLDSRDLTGELPGDVLLIFVTNADGWLSPDDVYFEWITAGQTKLAEVDQSLIATSAGPFFGVIYRTADFPGASKIEYEISIHQSFNLPVINGTKISGIPHFIQNGGGDGEYICQLGSIKAAPEVPYPWANHPTPLQWTFDDDGIHGQDNRIVFADMGSLYMFRDGQDQLVSLFESY